MKKVQTFFGKRVFLVALLLLMVFTVSACSDKEDDDVDSDDVLVTSVSVTTVGDTSTITQFGGTLQMVATILPTDATDSSFIRTVTNGTGTATISTGGLLTAVSNGSVTVNAKSNDSAKIVGVKVITISNQAAASMDATLTEIEVDGQSILDFQALEYRYVYVLSDGVTSTPSTSVTKFETSSTVVITDAVDVTSSDELDRTTTIVVTTSDAVEVTYYVVFEQQIAPVDLGTAGNYVILAETGISTTTTSAITGDIAVSPAAATYITGFSLTADSSGEYSISDQVVGNVYASDYTVPTPGNLTTAVEDMMLAYSDAAGRAANYTELYSGDLSGKTLTPGVFKFGNSVLINTDLTLTGSATDVWIFQIAGNLTMASNINIILAGGADAKNIIWQVADTVAIGSGSHFEGTILAMTDIAMGTNSSINGRLYAQTAVTLDAVTVVKSND